MARVKHVWNQLMCQPLHLFDSPKTVRTKSGTHKVAISVFRANIPLIGVAFFISFVLFMITVSQGVVQYGSFHNYRDLFIPLYLSLMFVFTVMMHESAHFYLAHRYGLMPIGVRRGWRVSVVYKKSSLQKQRLVSVSGPVVGSCAALLLGSIGFLSPEYSYMSVAMVVVAVAHGLSLLPWMADGKRVWVKAR